MSFLTLTSLVSTVSSGVVDLAAHLSDGAAKGKPAKPSGKDKASHDLVALTNAFAAAMAAASAATAPLAAAGTANSKTPIASGKSANGVPIVPTAAAATPGRLVPQLAASTVSMAAKTGTLPPAAATNAAKTTAAPALAAKQHTPAASSRAAGPATSATPSTVPAAKPSQATEIHLGLHTLIPASGTDTSKSAPETMTVSRTAPASVVATPPPSPRTTDTPGPVGATNSTSTTGPQALHHGAESGSLTMPMQQAVPAHGMTSPDTEGIRLTSLSYLTQSAASVSSSDGKPSLASGTSDASNHDSRSHSDSALSAPIDTSGLAAPSSEASPPNPVAAPAPVPVADQLTRAILAQAEVIQHVGRTDLHLRLDPPQLGSVQIHLTATQHTVSARIVVAHEGTQQLLTNQAHHLRQGLAAAGLALGSFDVTRDGSGSGGGGQQPPPQTPLSLPLPASSPRTTTVASLPIPRLTDGIDLLA